MWRERLVRIGLLAILVTLVLVVAKSLVKSPSEIDRPAIKLPALSLDKVETGNILGTVQKKFFSQEAEPSQENESAEGVEPIAEPVTNVQNQANTLIELIKKLPEDQVKAVKKQLCKELCEE
jgi:hypothetical protein